MTKRSDMRLYSLKEIRQILLREGIYIPDGTLRNYRDEFGDLLEKEGSGRFTRYHINSLNIFKEIRKLRAEQHLDGGQIREHIRNAFFSEKAENTPENKAIHAPHVSGQTMRTSNPGPWVSQSAPWRPRSPGCVKPLPNCGSSAAEAVERKRKIWLFCRRSQGSNVRNDECHS